MGVSGSAGRKVPDLACVWAAAPSSLHEPGTWPPEVFRLHLCSGGWGKGRGALVRLTHSGCIGVSESEEGSSSPSSRAGHADHGVWAPALGMDVASHAPSSLI